MLDRRRLAKAASTHSLSQNGYGIFCFFIFVYQCLVDPPKAKKNVANMVKTYSPTPEGVNTRARLRRCAAPLPIRPLPPLS